ncbi:protoporphyrinogen oxidase [Jatrophihabitans sp. DSM 45814]
MQPISEPENGGSTVRAGHGMDAAKPAPRIVVVGAGISGLAAAQRLAALRPDAEVIVLEAAPAIGGKLRRVEVGGSWVDVGAEAMLARRPEGIAAAEVAGLGGAVIHPLTTAAMLRNRGTNRRLPAGTLLGIPADLESLRAARVLNAATLRRIEDEPNQPRLPMLEEDVSVGDLVASRFGSEVVERIVDPLLGGVYAGHAEAISLRAAIPGLAAQLMAEGGSLLDAARAKLANAPATNQPVFASLDGGLARLADGIASTGSFTVRTSSAVRELRRTRRGFGLVVGPVPDARLLEADAVVLATPASKSALLLAGLAPAASVELSAVESASMAIVTLAFDVAVNEPDNAGTSLPAGSGILIPSVEGHRIKAMTFSSQKWPGVGRDSRVTLMRASLGRAGEEWTLQREDAELVTTVRQELATITGFRAQPVDSHVQRWGGALPQYAVGHLQRVAKIRAAVAEIDGLAVCGATYDGVGIPACIASAHLAVDRILNELSRIPVEGQNS